VVEDKFFTMSFAANQEFNAYLTRLGANDPDNNLRSEQAIILRMNAQNASFLTVYEGHGRYDNDEEVTVYNGGSVRDMAIDTADGLASHKVALASGRTVFLLTSDDPDKNKEHKISHDGTELSWLGPVGLVFVDATDN
ncbi:MAG: heparinase, partial [Pseudomonadota bacterium]